VIKLKQKEFLSLRQGSISVTKYFDKSTHFSSYAPDEVNTDPVKPRIFKENPNPYTIVIVPGSVAIAYRTSHR
jgi:hypothetical protein